MITPSILEVFDQLFISDLGSIVSHFPGSETTAQRLEPSDIEPSSKAPSQSHKVSQDKSYLVWFDQSKWSSMFHPIDYVENASLEMHLQYERVVVREPRRTGHCHGHRAAT